MALAARPLQSTALTLRVDFIISFPTPCHVPRFTLSSNIRGGFLQLFTLILFRPLLPPVIGIGRCSDVKISCHLFSHYQLLYALSALPSWLSFPGIFPYVSSFISGNRPAAPLGLPSANSLCWIFPSPSSFSVSLTM